MCNSEQPCKSVIVNIPPAARDRIRCVWRIPAGGEIEVSWREASCSRNSSPKTVKKSSAGAE